jgi:hypothetical protein
VLEDRDHQAKSADSPTPLRERNRTVTRREPITAGVGEPARLDAHHMQELDQLVKLLLQLLVSGRLTYRRRSETLSRGVRTSSDRLRLTRSAESTKPITSKDPKPAKVGSPQTKTIIQERTS